MGLEVRWIGFGLLMLLGTACGPAKSIDPITEPVVTDTLVRYQMSLDQWNQLKQTKYGVGYLFTQTAVGGGVTTLFIQNNRVSGRALKGYGSGAEVYWYEAGPNFKSAPEAYDVMTLDQIYAKCRDQIISQESAQVPVTFKVDADGVLKECAAKKIYPPGIIVCEGPGPSFNISITSISVLTN